MNKRFLGEISVSEFPWWKSPLEDTLLIASDEEVSVGARGNRCPRKPREEAMATYSNP